MYTGFRASQGIYKVGFGPSFLKNIRILEIFSIEIMCIQRKSGKQEYIHLISDATRVGWRANYTTLEIGVLGHYLPSSPIELSAACPNIHHNYNIRLKSYSPCTAKIAIGCSYSIFMACDELKWSPRPLLLS